MQTPLWFLFVLFLKLELGHIQAPDLQCWIRALSWSSLGSQLFGFMQPQNRWPERIRPIKDVLANLGLLFFFFIPPHEHYSHVAVPYDTTNCSTQQVQSFKIMKAIYCESITLCKQSLTTY